MIKIKKKKSKNKKYKKYKKDNKYKKASPINNKETNINRNNNFTLIGYWWYRITKLYSFCHNIHRRLRRFM